MSTRAYNLGYRKGFLGFQKENNYKRISKINEYDSGYDEGFKMHTTKTYKNKPILFHNGIPNHSKKRITLSIKGGCISDIVRENVDCEVVVHDYDIEGVDVESNIHCKQDESGEFYQRIELY